MGWLDLVFTSGIPGVTITGTPEFNKVLQGLSVNEAKWTDSPLVATAEIDGTITATTVKATAETALNTGVTSIDVAAHDVVMTPEQSSNAVIKISGNTSTNRSVYLDSAARRVYFVVCNVIHNETPATEIFIYPCDGGIPAVMTGVSQAVISTDGAQCYKI